MNFTPIINFVKMEFRLKNLIPSDYSRAQEEEYELEEDEEIIEKKEFSPIFLVKIKNLKKEKQKYNRKRIKK
jgi:hypothetical protein